MITNSRYSTHETLTKKKGYSSKIFSMAAFGVGSKDLSTLMLLPCVTRFHCLSQSHGSFFITHGFTNFERIFYQALSFLRKQTQTAYFNDAEERI